MQRLALISLWGNFAMKTLFFATFICSAVLAGCAVRGDVQPAATTESAFKDAFYDGEEFKVAENPEGYKEWRIFSQGASGFVPQNSVRGNAVKRAQAFCKTQDGQNLRILTEHRATGAKIAGNFPRVELVFVCVPPNKEVNVYDRKSMRRVAREAKVAKKSIDTDKAKYDKLEQLGRLHKQGVLTDAEFKTEKKRILQ